MREAFASLASHIRVFDDVDLKRRDFGSDDLPFQLRIGGLIVFIDFETLDTLVTQGGFTREAWLRERTKCASCKGTGTTGHPESPDSCQVCRGTGIGEGP